MKTKRLIFPAIMLVAGAFVTGLLVAFKQAEQPKQTEEYAFLVVKEWGADYMDVLTTIGENQTKQETTRFDKPTDKNTSKMNYGYVLKKMHELNAMGFELVSTTATPTTINTNWSFMFKRKVK